MLLLNCIKEKYMNRIDKELLVKFCFSKYSYSNYKLDTLKDIHYKVLVNKNDKTTPIGQIYVLLENRSSHELSSYEFKYNVQREIVSCIEHYEFDDKGMEVIDKYNQFVSMTEEKTL